MGGSPLTAVDRGDVQGLAKFGYGKLTEACYLLARIKDAAKARVWCAAAPIATAEYLERPPETAMQIAFTAPGLRAIGADVGIVEQFSAEFCSGMAGDANRSRRLGDTGLNDPSGWAWGGPRNVPDVVFPLFAKNALEEWKRRIQNDPWSQAFEVLECLPTSDMRDHEPFGFRDGISQPELDWDRRRDVTGNQTRYGNVAALGEFLLGYPNEYGKYTDRPLVDTGADAANHLLPAEDFPGKRDLGRNGSYLVIRQLEQDVRGFWQYFERAARETGLDRESLGAGAVGRTRAGAPLIAAAPDDPQNGFNYGGDPRGTQCPFGAHIRRSNPRNADVPGHPQGPIAELLKNLGVPPAIYPDDLTASTRFHRILRRGREFGEELSPAAALQSRDANEKPRGLHFACINANIARQFEFIQSAWLMSAKFDGLSEESDPLLGNRASGGGRPASDNFSIPRQNGLRTVLTGLPQFVRVRGGAYFFMPGIRALRYLSQEKTRNTVK